MRLLSFRLLLPLLCLLAACKTIQKKNGPQDDGVIEVVFLQLNDVYEISPLSDGTGGLARVATLRKELLAKNPNTITVLSGDFISPSVIGTLKHEGQRIRGKQMVDAMNTLGVEWVVFGNHEFDYDQADLQNRLNESNFQWLGANVRMKTPDGEKPFYKVKSGVEIPCLDNSVLALQDADGTRLRLGMFGVLLKTGKKTWNVYTDPLETAKRNYETLLPNVDVCVALTHLPVETDKKLAQLLPNVPLLMGGHDHENQIHNLGGVTIAKADANARTVYVHTIRYDHKKHKATVKSVLRRIDATLAEEPTTAAIVQKWENIKATALREGGFISDKLVVNLEAPFDFREDVLRYQPTEAGRLLTQALLAAARHQPDAAIVNSGSVRVDDILSGPISEIDIVRTLPFGGQMVEAVLRGSLLRKTLDAGVNNKGNGGYLQWSNIALESNGQWLIKGKPLDDGATYTIAMPQFLLTGGEQNMAFLKAALQADGKTTTHPDVLTIYQPDPKDKTDLRNDMRWALIQYWRAQPQKK